MKNLLTSLIVLIMVGVVPIICVTSLVGCSKEQSSSDVQRDRQERMVAEGVNQVGMPSITNFRELKLAKDLYELRDKTGLTTYTYVWSEMRGEAMFLCKSIGYPTPYATQYSAPESVQRWALPSTSDRVRDWGRDVLPQAEPNGLFSPGSAEGAWVMCIGDDGKIDPTYIEPRVIVKQNPIKK